MGSVECIGVIGVLCASSKKMEEWGLGVSQNLTRLSLPSKDGVLSLILLLY